MICIIDYGVGNLTSIQNMLKKAGVASIISGRREDVIAATKILLPGMGHFDNCMQRFNASGLRPLIETKVFGEKTPLLGICVGLQMFMESSEEGTEKGLGWVKGKTIRFDVSKMKQVQKIPNMGWHEISIQKRSLIEEGLEHSRFYFAHSFHVVPEEQEISLISVNYGYPFTAGIEQDNVLGVQFHPEKSHRFGMQLLSNFANKFQ